MHFIHRTIIFLFTYDNLSYFCPLKTIRTFSVVYPHITEFLKRCCKGWFIRNVDADVPQNMRLLCSIYTQQAAREDNAGRGGQTRGGAPVNNRNDTDIATVL